MAIGEAHESATMLNDNDGALQETPLQTPKCAVSMGKIPDKSSAKMKAKINAG
jgi:hypothetical protein